MSAAGSAGFGRDQPQGLTVVGAGVGGDQGGRASQQHGNGNDFLDSGEEPSKSSTAPLLRFTIARPQRSSGAVFFCRNPPKLAVSPNVRKAQKP